MLANDNLAAVFYYSGEYDRCIVQCRKTLEFDPLSRQAFRHLGLAYAQKQLFTEAITCLKKSNELPHASDEVLSELGYVYAVSGKKEDARKILKQLIQPPDGNVSHYRLAIVYMGLGERDRTLEALAVAVNERSPGVVHLKVSPIFAGLRSDARFQEFLREMGLEAKPI